MITAVDSSVLLDVFTANRQFGATSREALRRARQSGSLVACEAVWAEVTAAFDDEQRASSEFERLGIVYASLDRDAAQRSGLAWRAYRRAGGPRTRILADFLIGAHALTSADRLLTRDRGFYRAYFGELELLDPSV